MREEALKMVSSKKERAHAQYFSRITYLTDLTLRTSTDLLMLFSLMLLFPWGASRGAMAMPSTFAGADLLLCDLFSEVSDQTHVRIFC